MGEAKPKCCHTTWSGWSHSGKRCKNNASLEHDGKHYCKLHHPPTVKAKQDERQAKLNERWDAMKAAREEAAAILAEQARRADAYDQLVERVKELEGVARALVAYDEAEHEDHVLLMLDYADMLKAARAALSKARPNTAEGE